MTRAHLNHLYILVLLSGVLALGVACDEEAPLDAAVAVDSGARDGSVPDGGRDAARPADSGPEGPDAGPPSGTAVFVAQGHLGRTTISCDGGRTWVADRSLDDSAECWPEVGEFDCDHHPGAAQGLTWGNGHFYATWGWGAPGGIDRSRDGRTWERVLDATSFGGIAFGGDVVLAGARTAQRSPDGTSWSETADTMLSVWNVRRVGFAEGLFVMVGSDGPDVSVVVSADGNSWRTPTVPAGCGNGVQTGGGIVGGGGTILILGGDGVACTSRDGETFVSNDVGAETSAQVVWTGSEFVAWSRGSVHRSADGVSWTSTNTTPAQLDLGAVAYDPGEGVYVGVRGGWRVWYDNQVFYRSTDGVTWAEAASYTGSHPIRFLQLGYVDSADLACD